MTDASLEFIGTATSLLRLGPFTLLTDPNFLHRGQRAYLGKGLWSRRLTEPSRQPDQLPSIDAVVLSHLHGDHFDRVARRELPRDLPILTTPQAQGRLRHWGFEGAEGMGTWETWELTREDVTLRVSAMPGVHAPGPLRVAMPSVMGTILELRRAGDPIFRVYLSGDTLCRPWLREIVDRVGPLDAAVLHLGGTRILGVTLTMDGRQGVDLMELLAPSVTVPVHYDDYGVFKSPLAEFLDRAHDHGVRSQVRTVRRGETISLR